MWLTKLSTFYSASSNLLEWWTTPLTNQNTHGHFHGWCGEGNITQALESENWDRWYIRLFSSYDSPIKMHGEIALAMRVVLVWIGCNPCDIPDACSYPTREKHCFYSWNRFCAVQKKNGIKSRNRSWPPRRGTDPKSRLLWRRFTWGT